MSACGMISKCESELLSMHGFLLFAPSQQVADLQQF